MLPRLASLLQSPPPNLNGVSQQAGTFLKQDKVAELRERVTVSNVFSGTHLLLIRDKLSPLYFLAFLKNPALPQTAWKCQYV